MVRRYPDMIDIEGSIPSVSTIRALIVIMVSTAPW